MLNIFLYLSYAPTARLLKLIGVSCEIHNLDIGLARHADAVATKRIGPQFQRGRAVVLKIAANVGI